MSVMLKFFPGQAKSSFICNAGKLLFGAAFLWHGIAGAEPIATVEITDGTVFVKQADGKYHIVAKDSQLNVGDTISTQKDSYARLRFTDGGEVAVRPATSILMSSYYYKDYEPNNDNFSMRLIKGGLRTVTGLIGKRGNQNAYRLDGGTATIGIRGTDFIARVCDKDCAREEYLAEGGKKNGKAVPQASANPIAARLFKADGQAFVTPLGGKSRPLMPGDPVYVGDSIEAAATGFAMLVFSDESRVLVSSGGVYSISAYRYTAKSGERNQMLTELVRGGLRVVTGLMGKRQPVVIRYNTTTATIGIRGTNFDLLCAPTGSASRDESELDPGQNGPASCDQALYASTRDGTIEVESGQIKILVPKDKVGYVDTPGAAPMLLDKVPIFLRDNPMPKPERMDVDAQELFGKDGSEVDKSGLYVMVKDGRVSLMQQTGEKIELNTGESGFAGAEGMELFKMGFPLRLSIWTAICVIWT